MDKENKNRIISAAENLFLRFGVRSVTMDDVAREVSMSKKTLYHFFENKDSLVTAVARDHLKKERQEYSEVASSSANSIEELHQIATCMRKNLLKMNPSLLHDLQKFHSDAWKEFLEFKQAFIKDNVKDNLIRGMEEGFYRADLDPEILAVFRVEQVQMIFEEKIFPQDKFDFATVQMELFNHFIHGLLSEKGREEFNKYQEELKTAL